MHNKHPHADAEHREMQSQHPLNPDDLDQLLDGHSASTDVLTRLITAARTTGAPADRSGLIDALAAFAAPSSLSAIVAAPHRSLLKAAVAKIGRAKLLLLSGAVVAATGGIAVAASTGSLPNPLPGTAHTTQPTDGLTQAGTNLPSGPSHSQPTTGDITITLSTPSPSESRESPSPSLAGLCRSWLARPHVNGKADSSAAFTVLVTTAGGQDSVDAYCTTLLGAAPTQPSTTKSKGNSNHSTSEDTDNANSAKHTTGKPTT